MARPSKTLTKPVPKRTRRASSPPPGAENGTCPEIFEVELRAIVVSLFNDDIYGAIDPDDTALDGLAQSVAREGQLDPVVLTLDDVLISGHRRRAVAIRLGLKTLKARRHPILSTDAAFVKLLVEHNEQRDKTPAVRTREQLVLVDPASAYENLLSERADASRVSAETLQLGECRARSRITAAKMPLLDAIASVVGELKQYWPLSDRRIHYALLNNPPLLHAGKPGSRYRNDERCYKATCELLTRARIEGRIPFEAVGDETRPVRTWDAHPNVSPFVRRAIKNFLSGYWRDLQQGQPNHIEILGEKLTIEGVVRPVAARYCVPFTIGRGYSSLPPRKAMYDRFKMSGKAKLVILVLSDHDPEGWDIAETFARSMRDDFGIADVVPVKVALTPDQIQRLNLPPNTDAKTTSSRYRKFAARFGPAAYELEAVTPTLLGQWLDEHVRSVMDIEQFNAQVEAETQDAATLAALKSQCIDFLKGVQPA